jgi:hypothetical protein
VGGVAEQRKSVDNERHALVLLPDVLP